MQVLYFSDIDWVYQKILNVQGVSIRYFSCSEILLVSPGYSELFNILLVSPGYSELFFLRGQRGSLEKKREGVGRLNGRRTLTGQPV